MPEKTPDIQQPVLAILAGTPSGIADYLRQLAHMAGWRQAEGGEFAKTSVRVDKTGLVFNHDNSETILALPARAARILNYLRRAQGGDILPEKIVIGSNILLPQDYLLMDEAGQAIRLTEKEAAILVCLSRHGGKAVSRQALLDAVWAYAPGVETHTLETHIYRLRQKIEEDPANPARLLTLDEGYALIS